MDLHALNAEFGIPGTLSLVEGPGGLTLIEIANPLATARLATHGGQVLAYRPRSAREDLLFVGERAHFAPDREIKGGVPLCWPWFGRDPAEPERVIHGFARVLEWTPVQCEACADGSTRVRMRVTDDARTRAIWPHAFVLEVEIRIGATLSVALTTRNPGDSALRITQGLHAYFRIGGLARLTVEGLDGCRYLDYAAGAPEPEAVQEGDLIFRGEVNRIYERVPSSLSIQDPGLGRRIRIDGRNSGTCVVWNPWIASARAMEDLDDGDYLRFICVETVNAASEVIEIPPGDAFTLAADYRIQEF
ncbi:D-hexose-6-phosphate mutarotase [Imhoffiella purpurea]|uniref:Putative glucose-6-phosphate 1-epimerase n=1 Tax=Imhoffiella purpurea TaxID=1249627 RepID=W9V2B2_9GAMM|nr:D-hexose-6-phosphate mutarotase [Imhoffiella purpurea]EXJ13454.1 Aldose 1-epimerase [Imhoffiella purpurea]